MSETEIAKKIEARALSLGFERCGIIRMGAMKEYGEKLAERASRFPEAEGLMCMLRSRFADTAASFPWAKSIVVCSWNYGVYRVPENLNGLIGKAYVFDARRKVDSDGYKGSTLIERYMTESLNMRTASNRDGGITALRWAALASGIGYVRKNNFFYGDHGSYYMLSAFLIDAELEYINDSAHKPCPDNCDKCVKSCPTRSLAESYAMCPMTCVSFLTNKVSDISTFEKYGGRIGGWIYGCDVCQDVCPHNKGQWLGDAEFPGLQEAFGNMSLEGLLTADYGYLRSVVAEKFWYIVPDDVWMWKRNVLNAMRNNWDDRYAAAVESAKSDEDERVREIARKMVLGVK